jgi:hypothetical protein
MRYVLNSGVAAMTQLGAFGRATNHRQRVKAHGLSPGNQFDLQPKVRWAHTQRPHPAPTPITEAGVVEDPRQQIEHQGSTLL